MNTKTNPNRIPFLTLAVLPLLVGCSTLGFSTYPVAHVMTDDTKAILGQTSARSDVPRELAKEVQSSHFLEPGDELLVEALSDQLSVNLPADQRVMPDGSIDLGRYGRLVVASMTLEQAEDAIQRMVSEKSNVSSDVNVRLIQPIDRYYVVGEVNSPGAYPLTGYETVLDAILEAGGLTARASACDLLLARPTSPCSCRVTLPVCYRAITQLGDTTTNYHLQPGDRIFVARQSMREELCAYIKAGKTCGRCCQQQRVCCDPRMATRVAPEFVSSAAVAIQPVERPETDAEELPTAEEIDGDSAESASEPLNPPQPVVPPLNEPQLDGELDFGLLLSTGMDQLVHVAE
jgi:protein involved in polysaccharide export with SLBB domain